MKKITNIMLHVIMMFFVTIVSLFLIISGGLLWCKGLKYLSLDGLSEIDNYIILNSVLKLNLSLMIILTVLLAVLLLCKIKTLFGTCLDVYEKS